MFKSLIFIIIVIFFFSCSGKQEPQHEVEKTLVKSFKETAGEENQYLYRGIASFAVDSEESIYIVDNMSNDNRLIKIDKNGKHRWQLDTNGQGPGEFLRITDVCCLKDRVFVCDQNRRKILIFSNNGEFINEFKVIHSNPLYIEIAPEGIIYVSLLNPVNDMLLHKYTQAGKYLGAIIPKRYHRKNAWLDAFTNGFVFCIDQHNDIILAFRRFYIVYRYTNDGKLLNKWSRELPYKPQTARLVQPAPGQLEIEGDHVIQDIAVDNKDRIYILWGCKGNDMGMQVDLFSSRGVLLSEFHTGVKPFYDSQFITIDSQNNFYVANQIEEPGIYKFKISIPE